VEALLRDADFDVVHGVKVRRDSSAGHTPAHSAAPSPLPMTPTARDSVRRDHQ